MKSSDQARQETVSAEGDKLEAYLDVKGIPTIGRGNIYMPNGERVKLGDRVTPEEEEALFQATCAKLDKLVTEATGLLPQNKFDACWMFAYNEGIGQFMGSTLHKKIVDDMTDIDIPNEFMKWIYAKVKGVETIEGGLVIRRGKEIAMWLDCPLSEVRQKWVLLDEELKKQNL